MRIGSTLNAMTGGLSTSISGVGSGLASLGISPTISILDFRFIYRTSKCDIQFEFYVFQLNYFVQLIEVWNYYIEK